MSEIVEYLEEKEKTKRTFKDVLLDFFDMISFLVFVFGIVLFIRFFLFNPYTVVGQSMEPTFDEKDFIIVDKITPKIGTFQRGDIIVFVPAGKDVPYIKRIIGLPGEVVKIDDGEVYVCNNDDTGENCQLLQEDYLPEDIYTKASCGITEFKVDEGKYFVLGDNRDHSTDSRCCFGLGCYSGANYLVGKEDIIGKVYIKLLPEFGKY